MIMEDNTAKQVELVKIHIDTPYLCGRSKKVKVKSSMARSLPVWNLLPQNVGSIINYLQYTEAALWGTPSCSQPQPATDNGVRDGRSN